MSRGLASHTHVNGLSIVSIAESALVVGPKRLSRPATIANNNTVDDLNNDPMDIDPAIIVKKTTDLMDVDDSAYVSDWPSVARLGVLRWPPAVVGQAYFGYANLDFFKYEERRGRSRRKSHCDRGRRRGRCGLHRVFAE